MVLYYGLFAFQRANNTIAASIERTSSARKSQAERRMTSSSNSWIYTEDLKKHFEERYVDYRYIFIPIYIDEKHARYSIAIISPKSVGENSSISSRSVRNHFTNVCVSNPAFQRDEIPMPKKFVSSKDKQRTNETSDNDDTQSTSLLQRSSVISSEASNALRTTMNNELTSAKQSTSKRRTFLRSFLFK